MVLVFFGIGCGTLCRCAASSIRPVALLTVEFFEADLCMLRCWTWDAVPNWLLYSSVLHVRRYADTATFSQFRTGRKRPLPSLAVGVSAGDVASVRAAVEEV